MTTTAIPTLIVAVAALVLSACGSEAKPDEKQLVSEECHHAVKELRDPDSARYGDEEYIAKVKLGPWSEQGKDPNIATVYGFVGNVNGRNGFGGMGEFQSYQCDVYFNKSGEIDQSKTHIGYVDKLEFLDNYVGYLKDDAIETIVTKTVTPDGSPAS